MPENIINNNILSLLDHFVLDNADDIARQVADNYRKRRVEMNISRREIAEKAGVPLPTVARFEQKGLISFETLVKLAIALGYASDVRNLFSTPHFNTIEELDMIRRKSGDKRAYPKGKKI